MADEQYVIDVTVQAFDKTSEPLAQAQRAVSQFDKAAEQTAKRVQSLSRTPFDLTIRALDRATTVLDRVDRRASSMVRKPYELVVRVKDVATAPMRGIMNMMTSYQTYMLGFMAAGVGAATVAWPLKLADNLQQANIAFTTMLGSQQKAAQFMQQVQQFAISTPFSTADIIKNAQFMMALGFQANQVIPTLQAVGDAASAMGGSADLIQRILLALGQMQAHGKVDAQDMLQLTSANIPAWQILANSIHKSVAETQQLAQAGKLEAAPAVQAILKGMEQLYGGQMQKNANATFSGLMSQITDTFKIDIVTKWGQGIERAVLPALARFNDWLGRNQAMISRWGDTLANVAQQGAQWVVDKVKALMSAVDSLVNSRAWQQADTLGSKLRVAWDQVVVAPFDSWWQGGGQQQVARIAANIGSFLGSTLNGAVMGLLGLATPSSVTQTVTVNTIPIRPDPVLSRLSPDDQAMYLQSFVKTIPTDPWVSAGQTAGAAFFSAFAKAFNADEIAGKLVQAFGNVQPWNAHSNAGRAFGVGVDVLAGVGAIGLLSRVSRAARTVGGVIRTGYRWDQKLMDMLFPARKPASASDVKTVSESVDAAESMPRVSGLVDKYGKPIPSVLSTVEQTQQAVRAAEQTSRALDVVKSIARRIPGLNLLMGAADVASIATAAPGIERAKTAGSVVGEWAGTAAGAATGAAIGSVIPGAGTIAGAVIGGLLGLAGSYLGGKAAASAYQASHATGPAEQAPVSSGGVVSVGQQRPQVTNTTINLGGVNVPISITGDNPDQILAVIRQHIAEIGDELANQIAISIERVHANMPARATAPI
ncbi:MAG: tape measure protein [Alicyclobacillus macrosporangiidus]|uniref:tape measure protein n=1 Tax=Alicyclobacillus macrosporangiidus TaxID=392015 RepID=UPI0026EC1665|nr:tape measure protein [Alicyclobacillus macrosporangiidus]MCL6597939.1 tape measure protein [Alicyclobacillus macrosporangiidus]